MFLLQRIKYSLAVGQKSKEQILLQNITPVTSMSKSNLQLKLERTHLLKFPSCCYRSSRYSEQAKQDISLIMGPHKLMNRKRESTSNKPSATCICLTFNRTQHSHGTQSHLAQDFCPCFCQMFHHFLLITRGYVGRIFRTLTIWEGQTLCCNYCP